MSIKIFLHVLLLFPILALAQEKRNHAFGDRLLLGVHYGYAEDFVGERNILFERTHFAGFRAGISMTRYLYTGIQTRVIRASNFETPAQNFYMAGIFARCYLLHPAMSKSSNRVGVFLESGFMLGNYAFENRNSVEYAFEQPGSWYIPGVLGAEFRIWKNLSLEAGMNLIYNNGGSWDQYGIAHMSIGVNWHW